MTVKTLKQGCHSFKKIKGKNYERAWNNLWNICFYKALTLWHQKITLLILSQKYYKKVWVRVRVKNDGRVLARFCKNNSMIDWILL